MSEKKVVVNKHAGESKEQRFKRIVAPRMTKLLKQFKLVRACFNGQGYACSEEDFKKIYNTLVKETESIETSYNSHGRKEIEEFSL